jgi:hypothetical protein
MKSISARRHAVGPPDIRSLFDILRRRNVDYVLVGSVGAAAYGVEVQPGDLDIVPSVEHENLERLIQVLADVEATPLGPFGDWTVLDSGEWKWIERPTSEAELRAWTPHAEDVDNLDHLFVTGFGNFDVVPKVAGTFETLQPRACRRSYHGCDVCVAHIDDLLARTTIPRREKDRTRVTALRELQRKLALRDL